MAEKLEGLSKNLKQSSTWYRIFSMLVLSLLVFAVAVPLIIVLAISQALLTLVSGSNNQNLRYFGMEMTDYVNQVLRYITYNSEKKPYPFSTQSTKANLGVDRKSSIQSSQSLFKRSKSKEKKKLYEIETTALTGEQTTAGHESAQNPVTQVKGSGSLPGVVKTPSDPAEKNEQSGHKVDPMNKIVSR